MAETFCYISINGPNNIASCVCARVCVWAASCVYVMCMDDEADVASLNPPGSSEADAAALNSLNMNVVQ